MSMAMIDALRLESLNDVEAAITNYRRNSSTLDSIASTLALKSLESRRDELRRALQPDNRSLRTLTDRELGDKHLPDRVMQWHGLTYGYEARDMIAAERLRRTLETNWNG